MADQNKGGSFYRTDPGDRYGSPGVNPGRLNGVILDGGRLVPLVRQARYAAMLKGSGVPHVFIPRPKKGAPKPA